MRNVTLCLLVVILFRALNASACNKNPSEMRLLTNIDKLMNSTQVMIVRGVVLRQNHNNQNDGDAVASENSSCVSFAGEVLRKASRFINSRVLEFDLASMLAEETAETPRRRRHQQQAVSMMLMGITIFLMVFVPMGFQFLAALGGKAFLMAKMALLLASVNGLKRVANSGVHYGLYQTMPEPGQHPSYGYDRGDGPRHGNRY